MAIPHLSPYPELAFRSILKTVRHARSEWNCAIGNEERKTHLVQKLQKQDPLFSSFQAVKVHALFQAYLSARTQSPSLNFRSMGKELVAAHMITEKERMSFTLAIAYSILRDFETETSAEKEAKKMFHYFWDNRQAIDERKCNRMLVKLRNFSFSKKIFHDFLSRGRFFEAFKLMFYKQSSPLEIRIDFNKYPSEARLWHNFFQGLHKFQATHEDGDATLLEDELLKQQALPADFQMSLKDFCACLIVLIHSEGLTNNHLIDGVLFTILTTFSHQAHEWVPEDRNVRKQLIEILENYHPFHDPDWEYFNPEAPTLNQINATANSEIYFLHKAYQLGRVYNACSQKEGLPSQTFSLLLWQLLAFRCIPLHSEDEFNNTSDKSFFNREKTIAFLNRLATDKALEPQAKRYIAFGQAMLREQPDLESFDLLGEGLPYLTGYFQGVAVERMNQFYPKTRTDLLRVAMSSVLHFVYTSHKQTGLALGLPKIFLPAHFTLKFYVYAQLALQERSPTLETLIPNYWYWINMLYHDGLEETQSFKEAYARVEPYIQKLIHAKEELLAILARDQPHHPILQQGLDHLCKELLDKVVQRWSHFAEEERKSQSKGQ